MKDFEKIYSEICEESSNDLRNAKKQKDKKIILTVVICFIIIGIFALIDKEKSMLVIVIALSALVILLIMNNEFVKFRKFYKKLVIEKIVKGYNEKLVYSPQEGVARCDYTISHFDNYFDKYFSEDSIHGIIGKNTNIQMSEVVTKEVRKTKGADGKNQTEEIETFRGLYGIARLSQNTNAQIYIMPNSNLKKYNGKRIEMESSEFEKYYDCFSEDKITALKLFSANLIEEFVKFQKNTSRSLEVKIENNTMYFRYKCGEMFEPPKFKDVLDEKTIKRYYQTIVYPLEIIEKIIQNVEML